MVYSCSILVLNPFYGLVYFCFSGNIPVANDVLKMIERCSDISSVSSLRILVGMLFGLVDFVGLKFEINSIISPLVNMVKNSVTCSKIKKVNFFTKTLLTFEGVNFCL